MKCKYCGMPIEKGENRCGQCGASIVRKIGTNALSEKFSINEDRYSYNSDHSSKTVIEEDVNVKQNLLNDDNREEEEDIETNDVNEEDVEINDVNEDEDEDEDEDDNETDNESTDSTGFSGMSSLVRFSFLLALSAFMLRLIPLLIREVYKILDEAMRLAN